MDEKKLVQGGIVIEQLKREAKRFAEHAGGSVCIDLNIWYHHDTQRHTVDMRVWDTTTATHHWPTGKNNDLRKISALIDRIISESDED